MEPTDLAETKYEEAQRLSQVRWLWVALVFASSHYSQQRQVRGGAAPGPGGATVDGTTYCFKLLFTTETKYEEAQRLSQVRCLLIVWMPKTMACTYVPHMWQVGLNWHAAGCETSASLNLTAPRENVVSGCCPLSLQVAQQSPLLCCTRGHQATLCLATFMKLCS